jgi:hypothetical protein
MSGTLNFSGRRKLATFSVNGRVVFCKRFLTREAFPLSFRWIASVKMLHFCSSLVIIPCISLFASVCGGERFYGTASCRPFLSLNPSTWLLCTSSSSCRCPRLIWDMSLQDGIHVCEILNAFPHLFHSLIQESNLGILRVFLIPGI